MLTGYLSEARHSLSQAAIHHILSDKKMSVLIPHNDARQVHANAGNAWKYAIKGCQNLILCA